jgi:hypothetical protein
MEACICIKQYEKYSFKVINAYYENPLPGVVYMEKGEK